MEFAIFGISLSRMDFRNLLRVVFCLYFCLFRLRFFDFVFWKVVNLLFVDLILVLRGWVLVVGFRVFR